MLLLLATKDSHAKASGFCLSAAAVLSPLLAYVSKASDPSAAAGTLGLIIHHVIWQQGLLQPAMTSLTMHIYAVGAATCTDRTEPAACMEHVVMLQLLADELEDPAAAR